MTVTAINLEQGTGTAASFSHWGLNLVFNRVKTLTDENAEAQLTAKYAHSGTFI